VKDGGLIGAGQRVELYEIAAYGTVKATVQHRMVVRRILMVTRGGTLKPKQKEELSASKEKRNGAGIDLLQKLGPGLITGASDDDPSGIGASNPVTRRSRLQR
jgi:hypothetical protein